MKIDTPQVHQLRDRLVALARESILPRHGAPRAHKGSNEEAAVLDRFRPFAEFLYLVAAADGHVERRERSVMLGAFRALTGGKVPAARLTDLEAELEERRQTEGVEGRLEAICGRLAGQPQDAELALSLGSALSLADEDADQREVELLQTLATWLRISPARAAQILGKE